MGRGSSKAGSGSKSSGNASSDGALKDSPVKVIETTRYLPGSRSYQGRKFYSDEILTAKTDGEGNLTFEYATPTDYGEPSSKSNTTATATFEVTHGAINGETVGIDWKNVKSISGQTYSLRQEAKENGLKFDNATKKWIRK